MTNEQLEAIKQAARAATPQDIDSAQEIDRYDDGSHYECPACGGEGCVPRESEFCNYDGEALGVQFYGIGNAVGAAEAYFRAVKPAAVLSLIERLERAEARIAASGAEPDREDWLDEVRRTIRVYAHACCCDKANVSTAAAELERLLAAPVDSAMAKDAERLDWLDRMNAALNRHYGTTYQWKVILSPNITRLMTGRQWAGFVGDIDLNDAQCGTGSFQNVRQAIDAAIAASAEGKKSPEPQ
ncbi:hypothetical protein SAMN05446935_6112 [Burkholderia sp. YR290]|nr:hypothetical protein SAMN05446935_6112 [Burkholderia sp. YR290]